jgi:hypothetical protein
VTIETYEHTAQRRRGSGRHIRRALQVGIGGPRDSTPRTLRHMQPRYRHLRMTLVHLSSSSTLSCLVIMSAHSAPVRSLPSEATRASSAK